MDFLLVIGSVVIGSIIFIFFNRIFNIAYFGFKGLFSAWFTCCLVVALILAQVIGFVMEHYGWFIAAVVIILLLLFFGKKRSTSTENQTSGGTQSHQQ